MDETDRMAEFIENRAKETLRRFTRKRQARKILGKYDALGRTAPAIVSVSDLLDKLSTRPDKLNAEMRKNTPPYECDGGFFRIKLPLLLRLTWPVASYSTSGQIYSHVCKYQNYFGMY